MAIDYTSTKLIADVKRTGSVPTNQALLTEADFIAFMNDCLERTVIPNVQKVREEYFVHRFVTDSDGRVYEVPSRAIGGKVRQVQILDENENVLCTVQRLEPQIAQFGQDVTSWQGVFGYFFQDNNIHFTNDPSNTGPSVGIKFYRRPGKLVETSVCGLVTVVSGADITLETVPTDMVAGTFVDAIAAQPPFSSRGDSLEILSILGNVVTLSQAPTGLAIGDWLAPEYCSPVPQVPAEIHPILVQYAKMQIMDAIGDASGFARATVQFEELSEELFELIQDRDDGSPRKAVSPNGLWSYAPTRFWRF